MNRLSVDPDCQTVLSRGHVVDPKRSIGGERDADRHAAVRVVVTFGAFAPSLVPRHKLTAGQRTLAAEKAHRQWYQRAVALHVRLGAIGEIDRFRPARGGFDP